MDVFVSYLKYDESVIRGIREGLREGLSQASVVAIMRGARGGIGGERTCESHSNFIPTLIPTPKYQLPAVFICYCPDMST